MKNILLITFLIFTASILSGQQNQQKSSLCEYNESLMVGTWKMDTIFLKENVNMGDYKYLYDQKFLELRDSTFFVFGADYSYLRKTPQQTISGIWNVSNDGTMIVVKINGRDAEEKSRILELDKQNLVMSPMSESSNSKVVMKKIGLNE